MNENRNDFRFVGGREVRVIPKGWQHPKKPDGRYLPLLPETYEFEADQDRAATMPSTRLLAAEETEIAAYEAVTEGTPTTPAFPNTDDGRLDLIRYCAEHGTTFGTHKADAEAWAALLFGDAAVALDGRVIAEN